MRRLAEVAILAVLFPHYAIGSAGLTGKIQDIHNAPINSALITLWGASTSKGVQTRSVAGVYTFENLMEGEYLLKVEKDGYAILLGAVRLEDDAPHEINLVLVENTTRNAALVKAAIPEGLKTPESERLPADTFKSPPRRTTKSVRPTYPAASRYSRIVGKVTTVAVLRADGTLNNLVVLSAPNTELGLAALVAVRQWRYAPTYLDGRAIEINLTIDVTFTLSP